ncbi:type II and III secretion system protein family protein [Anianabacter salinae]|uniref:type II and III secretion system protein family protein n=1 Tax=Anianabacter salinae TaxID=2851023 RepID=UPI00225DDA3E|nr:type II and III secretion system protein family protein [Anianabacter salinae]MBV0911287.1 type II and III secretion system protein family protein [Anianabacter salinae]
MAFRVSLRAALLAVSACIACATSAGAQNLRIMNEQARGGTLEVPINRAVVVESDVPFAELSIANPSIADISTLSDRTIYVLGKTPGRTTLTLLGADGRLLTNVDVQVSQDVAEFKERLLQILPGEQVEVRTANDGIVLSGVVSSTTVIDRALDLAERYAPGRISNMMSVGGTQQVLLKVRFAEMRRSVRKELGASLGGSVGGNSVSAGGGNGQFADGSVLGNVLSGQSATISGAATGRYLFGFNLGGVQAALLLEALETKGLVRTLAEPNLAALSGQQARFHAGQEYPVPVVGDSGNVGIEYRPFGVEMTFTPTVLADKTINLELQTSVSNLDATVQVALNSGTVSGFSKREASTTIELKDGESFAIAGLLQDNFQDSKSAVPFLGDLPVLGALFRSVDYERNQTELVVIVTAHLVSPTRGEALALPTDRIELPTEAELFLYGNLSGGENRRPRQGAAGEVAQQDFSAPYGYVME